MIHLLFFGIISTDLLCALPTGMTSVKPSTNDSHRSVQTSHTEMRIVFPSKKDQQSLLIGCILHRDRKNEGQRKDCKGLHEKKKKILYQFNDRSSEEQNPLQDNDQQLIHLEKEKSGNSSIDEGYQWLSEEQDSVSDRNDDDSKTIEDFHVLNRKNSPLNISHDGAIHPINQTIFLSYLAQALKTLETIINDESIFLPSSEKFSSSSNPIHNIRDRKKIKRNSMK